MGLKRTVPHTGFILLSVAAHVGALYPAMSPGFINFGAPVGSLQTVIVDLVAQPVSISQPLHEHSGPKTTAPVESAPPPVAYAGNAAEEIRKVEVPAEVLPVEQNSSTPGDESPAAPTAVEQQLQQVVVSKPRPAPVIQPPLRHTEEFLSRERETLTYQVKLRGVPVGTAQMDASSLGGEFRISLKMNTMPALSPVYPVQNQIETRHIGGNFIISKIRRHEGTTRSDRGFTISLRDKSVFWADLIKRRSTTETIPTSKVLDPLSALYFLRNQQLQVGKKELLHVYDGDAYAELPVEVLRAEHMCLPGKGDIQTLVLKPQFSQQAIFHRTGDMLIWITADDYKVPVKIETSMVLGKVTAELVSAESSPSPDSSVHSSPKAR